MKNTLRLITAFLKKRVCVSITPDYVVILGSGVNIISPSDYRIIKRIPYKSIPHFPHPTVAGHKGELIVAQRNGVNVIIFSGRLHYYEGHNPSEVVLPVRIAGLLGAKHLIVTNAAGAVNPQYKTGDIMLIKDHINLMFMNPLIGKHDERLGPRFPDSCPTVLPDEPYERESFRRVCDCYSPQFIDRVQRIGNKLGINLRKGVYGAVTGPNFETPSEIKMLRTLGVDAIGMSTVPEVLAGVQMGMKVLGISCLVNKAAGLTKELLNHKDVLSIMRRINGRLSGIIREIIN
ncbi:MAG: purine-nucleoside phosphorylase [Planctomycetes bacterium]|nr:purine-nucleoside phosphorylase [Planctomycetota bacterium]